MKVQQAKYVQIKIKEAVQKCRIFLSCILFCSGVVQQQQLTKAFAVFSLPPPVRPLSLSTLQSIVQFLIDSDVDVNRVSLMSESPLHLAARHGFADIIKPLIDAGIEVDLKV